MFSNLLISLGGLVICVFGESIEMVTAGLLFAISGARNAFVICFNFLTETMTENLREKSSVLIQIFFGVGVLGNTIWYYLLYDWEVVFWYFYILPLVFVVIGFYLVVEDTPMCLVMRY